MVSFLIDLVIHILLAASATAAAAQLHPAGAPGWWLVAVFVVTYVVVSLVHRVLVQASLHATAGKALTGLRMIRDDNGRPPGAAVLLVAWLMGLAGIAFFLLSNW